MRECPGKKLIESEYFSFLFCFVEMFQNSFNCKSSLKQNSRLNFLSVNLVEFQ